MISAADILLVEDNAGDARLTQEALREAQVRSVLHIVRDGAQALSFLRPESADVEPVRPDLVLLDLNLPKKSGWEVLADIKADPRLRQIPVVILTTSKAEEDIVKSYDLHANCYVTKPVDLDRFMYVLKAICDFWLKVARTPNHRMR